MGIGPGNLEQIQYLGVIWQVKSYNSSTNEITVEDGLGDAAGFVANMWAGGYLFWLPGSKNAGAYTSISANGADTITCTPPNAPVAGDQFLIRLNAQVNVDTSENLAQVGGTDIPDDGAGNPVVPTRSARTTLTNRSGTITTGGTSQQLVAANASRSYLLIVNLSTDTLWISFGATAASAGQPSIPLSPAVSANSYGGGAFTMEGSAISTDAVQIYGATTGDAFSAWEG